MFHRLFLSCSVLVGSVVPSFPQVWHSWVGVGRAPREESLYQCTPLVKRSLPITEGKREDPINSGEKGGRGAGGKVGEVHNGGR